MTGVQIFAIAGVEVAKMLIKLFEAISNGGVGRMSPDEARAAAARILADVALDEQIERRQFERLRAERAGRDGKAEDDTT